MSEGTRRQQVRSMLEGAVHSFEDLRQIFQIPVKVLEDDLRHLERSLERGGQRLRIDPAQCRDCGQELRRRPGRFSTPGRCPACKGERLEPMRLEVR